ncbi:MAG: aldo/keto reductase [Sedimentisphaerales bacterium]|jgi:predicted aldo/keto reductase-like oxidoreductase
MWKKENNQINRRSFLKSAGIAGVGGAFAVAGAYAADAPKSDTNEPNAPAAQPAIQKVPKRKLGKTGVEVPVLSLGFGRPGEQAILRQSLDWGVNHWDTSLAAANGASEQSIGDFLAKNPDLRKDIFLVTKENQSKTIDDLEKCLQTSLKRLNTSYIDLYFGVYMVNDMARFTDDVRKWAENAKKRGVIKHFGFSTHQNMPQCLMAASKLDWIDAIQTSYNFRLLQDKQMQDAIDACHKAGIGLIAMKTQGMRQRGATADANAEAEADKKMLAHFLEKGFTEGQAKIKAVMDDQRISSVCSAMSSTAMLMTNIAVALDKTKLTAQDMAVLGQYAQATCSGYCAGCAHICEPVASGAPVGDIMRALMYHDSYGDTAGAKQVFAQIPAETRQRLLNVDYKVAEARCPNRMPIARLVVDAVSKLA